MSKDDDRKETQAREPQGVQGGQGGQAGSGANALISQYQMLQQQLQGIIMQKESLALSLSEVDRALEELGKTKEATAYRIIGNVMLKKAVPELKASLEETKEDIGVRIGSLEKTEKRIADTLRALQDKLKDMIR